MFENIKGRDLTNALISAFCTILAGYAFTLGALILFR